MKERRAAPSDDSDVPSGIFRTLNLARLDSRREFVINLWFYLVCVNFKVQYPSWKLQPLLSLSRMQ